MAIVNIRLMLQLISIYSALSCPVDDKLGHGSTTSYEEENDLVKPIVRPDAQGPATHVSSNIRMSLVFSAYLSHNLDGLVAGQTVVFDRVLIDDQDCYNTQSGVFTVPITGVYSFTYFIGSRNDRQVFVILTLDGKEMSEAEAQTNAKYDDAQGGNKSIFEANKGQRIEVRYKEGDGHLESNENERFTTFSGELLRVG